jgi:hypothetical protein
LPTQFHQIGRILFALILFGGFIYSGIATYRDYFIIWPANPNLFTHFEVGMSKIGEYINTRKADERIYLSPDSPEHPGIRYHSGLRDNVRGYNGRVCTVLCDKTSTATLYVIVPSKDKLGLMQLQAHYPQGEIIYDGPLHYGEPYFHAFYIQEGTKTHIDPINPITIQWSSHIQLLGYDLDKEKVLPGEIISLDLYYKNIESTTENYTAFVHLLYSQDSPVTHPLLTQYDSEPCHACYPTSMWKADEIIKDKVQLEIPSDAPPGAYVLATGFYELGTMLRLEIMQGNAQDNVAILGTIQVE